MSTGVLFSQDLAAGQDYFFGPVPAGKVWSFSVNFCNRTGAPVPVRYAVCPTNSVTPGNYIEYDYPVAAKNPLERTQQVMQAGYYVYVQAGAAGVSANGYGYER